VRVVAILAHYPPLSIQHLDVARVQAQGVAAILLGLRPLLQLQLRHRPVGVRQRAGWVECDAAAVAFLGICVLSRLLTAARGLGFNRQHVAGVAHVGPTMRGMCGRCVVGGAGAQGAGAGWACLIRM